MTAAKELPASSVLGDLLRTLRCWPIFAFYIAATLVVATIIGLITVNVIDLGMQHFGEASHRTHDVAYGALFSMLVLGVVMQLRRPQSNVAGVVMAQIPGAALLLVAALAGDWDRIFGRNPLRYAAAVAAVVALLHPSGRALFRSFRAASVSRPMLALVGAAAVPLLAFASSNIRLQRDVDDVHMFMGHYAFMAALAYAIVGVGVLASMRPVGWRLPACSAGLLAALLGVTSLLYPESTSSLTTGWAVAAVVWAVTFVAVAARTGPLTARPTVFVRRTRRGPPHVLSTPPPSSAGEFLGLGPAEGQ